MGKTNIYNFSASLPFRRDEVRLSNKEHHATSARSGTKHWCVCIPWGYKDWLRGSAFLTHVLVLTWQQRDGAALQAYEPGQVLACRFCFAFYCMFWTCQNSDPINSTASSTWAFIFISAGPRQNSTCNTESTKISNFQWVYQLFLNRGQLSCTCKCPEAL